MNALDHKNLTLAAPVVLLLFMLQSPHGIAQTAATVFAVTATIAVVQLAARFVWAPVFRKSGLRRATLFLGCALLAGLLATFGAGAMKLSDPRSFAWKLASSCAVTGLLFSWALAAFRGAQEKESQTSCQSPRSRSVLFRPSPPRSHLPS